MKGNLEGVSKYLDKMYGRYIQKVVIDPEDDEQLFHKPLSLYRDTNIP